MSVIGSVGQMLVIGFLSPRKFFFRFSSPLDSGLAIHFITFRCPLTRPEFARAVNIFPFFGCLWQWKSRRRGPMNRHDRQNQPRAIVPTKLKRSRHRKRSRQYHRPERV
jgi:hypothetical protein